MGVLMGIWGFIPPYDNGKGVRHGENRESIRGS